MNNRDLLRLAPWETIKAALSIDAKVLSTNPQQFEKENIDVYDIAINTWLLCIRDFAPYSWTAVATRISKDGLAATVKYFTDAASSFLRQEDLSLYPLASSLYREVQKRYTARSVLTSEYSTLDTPEGILLFLCRYLKRLTPIGADTLDTKAVKEFKDNQNRLKLIVRRGYNPLIIDLCRAEVNAGILRSRTRAYSYIKMCDVELSPGTCYSLKGLPLRSQYDKYASLQDEYAYDSIEVWRKSAWQFLLGNVATLMTVPKTLFSSRTIAPEQCLRQAIAHRMFTLRGKTPDGIDLQHQEINQKFAHEGSITNEWCTIDLSHASDDVTWVLVQEIYKDYPLYLHYLSRIRPQYVSIDGHNLLLQSFATMGNSMTFLVESEIFYIIAKAAVHFAQRYGVECQETVIVYGDDIIIDAKAYPFMQAFLEKLGFALNASKSFADGPFRESCGKEYINGVDVTSPYFPRQPLKGMNRWYREQDGTLVTVAESLISLQHRLMEISPIAAQYVELVIREHKPDLGYVTIGTPGTDLWSYDTVPYGYRYIPEYRLETKEAKNPWVFKSGKWAYSPTIERRVRTLVTDDIHRVNLQYRPSVEMDKQHLPSAIAYLQYLAHGPLYLSDVDREWGISTSRLTVAAGSPHTVWKTFEF